MELRKTGLAKSDSAPNAIHFTAPTEFGGMEGRWTPESLLLSAIAGCYTTTFRAIAEYSKFEYADLEVQVGGRVRKVESGYAFTEIVIRPKLALVNETDQQPGMRLLEKTKALCLIARALSVPLAFEPHIHVKPLVGVV